MNSGNIIVTTKSGSLEGTIEDGICVFRGIPYAAPPVGKLRWHPPQPVRPWDGTRQAKEYGPISPQNEMPGTEVVRNTDLVQEQDEDCLYLNIWTRGTDNKKRPVMVWLHGGAFIIGSGSDAMYRNHNIVKRGNVVLVTINYRLGAFGFMNLREITNGKIPSTGCEGLLDQVAALEWVIDNIEEFGGDPENVTVFGESAGGMSIGSLMGMPAARGKFSKAILESGAANTLISIEEGIDSASEFIKISGISQKATDSFYALSFKEILDIQQRLGVFMQQRDGRITPFQPVVDGIVMPELPIDAIKKGSASDIKTLAGTNLEEFKLFSVMDPTLKALDEKGMTQRLEGLIPPEQVTNVVEAYRKGRENRGESISAGDVLTAIQTDLMFRISCLNLVEAQCRNNQPAYNYLFTWKSTVLDGVLGACHTLEIGFVFGNYDASFCGTGPDADALSMKMQDAWFAFARTGNPGCESLGNWEPYCDTRTTMMLDKECGLEDAPYEEERAVWDTFDMVFTMPI